MDKQLKKIYLFVGIFAGIIFIGATYAFFTAGMSSENSTTVRADAGTMKITYDGGANITLSGIYPRDDVWATKNITVTGNNTTDTEMLYKLTLVVDSNTFKSYDPLQYELVSTNTSTNGEVIPAISKTNLKDASIELGSGKFVKANNAKHTYQLKIYYPRSFTSQNSNQGAAFSAHVEIESVKAEAPIISDNNWDNPSPGTLLEAIKKNNIPKETLTVPGSAVSNSYEALLASTEDDYGTSYYFRGRVDNNYVQFANKCWRIVRVAGDNTIKLTLFSDNTMLSTEPCSDTNTIFKPINPDMPEGDNIEYEDSNVGAFAQISDYNYKSYFNSKSSDNAYVGFKYGTVGASSYTGAHENLNESDVLHFLNYWFETQNDFSQFSDQIADTEWCADKTISSTAFDPWNHSPNGLGYAKNNTYYGAMTRLVSSTGRIGGTGPSLKCSGRFSKINSKVGLLAADEVVFAGYGYSASYSSSYLSENTGSNYCWWTMTPASHLSGESKVFVACYDNFSSYSVSSKLAVRPAISLKKSVLSTGNGTREDPFVVE